LNTKNYLVLDIGTSDIKCGYIDSDYNVLAQDSRKFPLVQNKGLFEIDFCLFYSTTFDLVKKCLAEMSTENSNVEALLITSQAQTFAPVDANFIPLCKGIVWLDERAVKEAVCLNEHLSDFSQSAGFKHPLPSLYISKLLWLKNNEPALFKKARAFPLINEFLAFRLTGKFYSDNTNFGMGGMYDFRHDTLNKKVLHVLGLREKNFPKIDRAVIRGELISSPVQKEWKLDYRFPIIFCGNDQGASASGEGPDQPGSVNINFGTAMVFYTITDSLTTDLTENQIAGKHPIGDDYFLLNFESDFGVQVRQLKDKFFKSGTYDQFFQTYLEFPDVDVQVPLSEETNLSFVSELDSYRYCAGIIKYYLNRFQFHFTQIQKSVYIKNITLSGGLTLSKVWLDILQSTLDQPVTINNRANAGLIGALHIYKNN